MKIGWLAFFAGVLLAAAISGGAQAQGASDDGDPVTRGAYLARAAGCVGCHTDVKGGGPELAGGRAMKTPFGTFYSPNITADPETGIGRWTDAEFLAAVKAGIRPDGGHYYPVFPYPSYASMQRDDALAIKAYLLARPPVRRVNRDHDLPAPFSWRWLMAGWKWLHFRPAEFKPDPAKSEEINRGAYLATALGHCGECHTPRNRLGALVADMALAGNAAGPGGERAPNITPDKATGIGDWSRGDLVTLMKTGSKPDFDNVQGGMREAIDFGLKYLTDADLGAMAAYLLAQPAVSNRIGRR